MECNLKHNGTVGSLKVYVGIALLCTTGACNKKGDYPILATNSMTSASVSDVIDMGVVRGGEELRCSATMRCLASGRILSHRSSCSCTSVVFPDLRIRKGDEKPVRLTIDTQETSGDYSVNVTFETDPPRALTPLRIVYHVRNPLCVKPNKLTFGDLLEGTAHTWVIHAENWGDVLFDSLEIQSAGLSKTDSEVLPLKPNEYEYGAPIQAWRIIVDMRVPPAGTQVGSGVLQLLGKRNADPIRVDIPVEFRAVPVVQLKPESLHLRKSTGFKGYVYLVFAENALQGNTPKIAVDAPSPFTATIEFVQDRVARIEIVASPDETTSILLKSIPLNVIIGPHNLDMKIALKMEGGM